MIRPCAHDQFLAAASKQLLVAQSHARRILEGQAAQGLLNIAAGREAYCGFGAKPQRTRNGPEARIQRVESGLLGDTMLTDICIAVSVPHRVSFSGEGFCLYQGPARRVSRRLATAT